MAGRISLLGRIGITKRRKKRKKRTKTMFYSPPRHKWLANIITIRTPAEARKAAKKLLAMAKKAPRAKKVLIKKAMVLARNRALAMAKKRNLSAKEKRELRLVAKIYERAYKQIVVR